MDFKQNFKGMYIRFCGQGSQSFSLGDRYRGTEVAQHDLEHKTKNSCEALYM